METNQNQAAQPAQTEGAKAPEVKIDVEAITKQVKETAVKIAKEEAEKAAQAIEKASSEKLAKASQLLSGEAPKNAENDVLINFAKNPVGVLAAVADIGAARATEDFKQIRNIEKIQNEVAGKYVKEYPGLESPTKFALVEKLAEGYKAQGLSYKEALDKGFQDTVKEFGLKSVSEAQRAEGYTTGLPGGGAVQSAAARKISEKEAQSNWLSGMKTNMLASRIKSK